MHKIGSKLNSILNFNTLVLFEVGETMIKFFNKSGGNGFLEQVFKKMCYI
jgi:hypothetical protein